MIRIFPNELWKEISIEHKLMYRYAVSNFGRLMSFSESIEDGRVLIGGSVEGYKSFRYKTFDGKKVKNHHILVHKLVANYFMPKTSKDQIFVLHLDRNRANNHINNLQWATKEEMTAHAKLSPAVIEAKKRLVEFNKQRDGPKLSVTKVMLIKKKIFDPNRKTRMKIIAKQFGISEMQLYRIKSGENWGHVKI
jgi:hypothetical protein